MATDTVKKPKRVMGPRTVKDKIVYLMYKGDLEPGSLKFAFNADEVFEAMDADAAVKRLKIVIPTKKAKPAAAPAV